MDAEKLPAVFSYAPIGVAAISRALECQPNRSVGPVDASFLKFLDHLSSREPAGRILGKDAHDDLAHRGSTTRIPTTAKRPRSAVHAKGAGSDLGGIAFLDLWLGQGWIHQFQPFDEAAKSSSLGLQCFKPSYFGRSGFSI